YEQDNKITSIVPQFNDPMNDKIGIGPSRINNQPGSGRLIIRSQNITAFSSSQIIHSNNHNVSQQQASTQQIEQINSTSLVESKEFPFTPPINERKEVLRMYFAGLIAALRNC
ncbi:12153_t:CDS:2, partial [Ambispora gerdemannii]